MRYLVLLVLIAALSIIPTAAQEDGLNLPTELYVLADTGQLQRFGQGAAGVATVTPEDTFVVDFGVAPDGVWLAYRTEASLQLLNMLNGETREIEGTSASFPPFRTGGQTVAWSPDAEVIAYTTAYGLRVHFLVTGAFADITINSALDLLWSPDGRYLAVETENNIWWVYRREVDSMPLNSAIASSVGTAWVDNGTLLLAPETGGLQLMQVDEANTLTDLDDTTNLYRLPAARRDGTTVLFGRPADVPDLQPDVAFLYRLNGQTLEPLSETPVNYAGLRWAPGGELLVRLAENILTLVEPVGGQNFPLPITDVTVYGWGALRPPNTGGFPLPVDGYFLADQTAFVGDELITITGLWQLPRDGSAPVPVTPPDVPVEAFTVAGDIVAYVSEGQTWVLLPSAEAPQPILEAEGSNNLTLTVDGSALTYDDGRDIYTLPIAGGEPQQLLQGYTDPRYSPTVGALLARIEDGGTALLDLTSNEVSRIGGSYAFTRWLEDGRVVAYSDGTGGDALGVYLIEALPGTPPALIYTPPAGVTVEDIAPVNASMVRIVGTTAAARPAPIQVIDVPLSGGQAVIQDTPGYITQPIFSPDGRYIAGYANATRALVLYDLQERREWLVSQPPAVTNFQWAAFR